MPKKNFKQLPNTRFFPTEKKTIQLSTIEFQFHMKCDLKKIIYIN